MTTIPMSVEGLKEQYECYKAKEDRAREELNQLRRSLAQCARDRKEAYRRWQKAIETRALFKTQREEYDESNPANK